MKEKAKELVDKFKKIVLGSLENGDDYFMEDNEAKQCALICVDEKMESYLKGFSTSHKIQKLAKNNIHYKELEQLKQDIEKL